MRIFISIFFLALLFIGCTTKYLASSPHQEGSPAVISVPEEQPPSDFRKELGRQFLLAAKNELNFVKDPEVVSFINNIGRQIVEAAESDPDYYHFFVVKSSQINAFAVPGGYIFIYDGLLKKLNGLDALAGVIAHEIAHVERDHHFRDSGKIALADLATMAGVILGGVAGKNPDASIAISEAANISYKLKLSRKYEEDADLFAIKYLERSIYDPSGLSDFFKKLALFERLNSTDIIPTYLSTHPGVIERQAIVESLIKDFKRKDPVHSDSSGWARIVTILKALNKESLNLSSQTTGQSLSNEHKHYFQGLHALKSDNYRNALTEYREAIRLNPEVPLYHADLAITYMHLQQMQKAKEEALKSIKLSKKYASPFIVLGISAANETNFNEAIKYFIEAEKLSPFDPFIHYHMASAYNAIKMTDHGRFHLGQYYRFSLDPENAARQFNMALKETRDKAFARNIEDVLKKIKGEGI